MEPIGWSDDIHYFEVNVKILPATSFSLFHNLSVLPPPNYYYTIDIINNFKMFALGLQNGITYNFHISLCSPIQLTTVVSLG